MEHRYCYQTPLGTILIADDGRSITKMSLLPGTAGSGKNEPCENERETPLIRKAYEQLLDYFAGKRESFDLPLNPAGTPFQQKVWEALRAIPYGETRTYKQIAEAVGSPRACRAVGMANNCNPVVIAIPCHRVIGADGKLVGYACGLDKKEFLLGLEKEHKTR